MTLKDVEHVARLARLSLSEEEKSLFARQMEDILTHIDQLSRLDTSKIPATYHALKIKNVLRKDEPRSFEKTESLLKNAPQREAGFFKVPQVI